jgi:purine-cytosine permease-like protein
MRVVLCILFGVVVLVVYLAFASFVGRCLAGRRKWEE